MEDEIRSLGGSIRRGDAIFGTVDCLIVRQSNDAALERGRVEDVLRSEGLTTPTECGGRLGRYCETTVCPEYSGQLDEYRPD